MVGKEVDSRLLLMILIKTKQYLRTLQRTHLQTDNKKTSKSPLRGQRLRSRARVAQCASSINLIVHQKSDSLEECSESQLSKWQSWHVLCVLFKRPTARTAPRTISHITLFPASQLQEHPSFFCFILFADMEKPAAVVFDGAMLFYYHYILWSFHSWLAP